jgi:hypothetical protein
MSVKPITVTGAQLIQAVREVAAERPETVIDRCVYFDPRWHDPVCLIGVALAKLGVTPEHIDMSVNNLCGVQSLARTGPESSLTIDASASELWWLDLVQGEQDAQKTWDRAVARADRESARAEPWKVF